MSSFAVLRIRKRNASGAAAMARHALRDGGPEVRNADPARADSNRVLVGPSRAAEAARALREALPAKRRKDAVECVELLITASPEAMRRKSVAAQDAYFRDALAWVGQHFGGPENVKLAVVHRDETTPHMQVLLVPLVGGKLQANKLIGGPSGLRKMQTDFAAQVGRKHGLERGLERKPGEARPAYQSIRRWYAAIAAAGGVDRIPEVRKVPAVPPEPKRPGIAVMVRGLIDDAARLEAERSYQRALAARKKAIAARDEAIAANRARTELINKLATIGLGVYGKDARSVGERLARATETEAVANKVYSDKRREFEGLNARYKDTAKALESMQADIERLERDVQARRQLLKLGELERYQQELLGEIQQLEERLGVRPQMRPR